MRYGIDAAVALEIALGHLPVHETHQLVGPGRLRSDAMAMLYEAVSAKAVSRDDAKAALNALAQVKIRLLNDRVSRATAWRIATSHDALSPAAAEYVAVAHLQADALVATDPEVVAQAEGLVAVMPLETLAQP